MAGRRAGLFNYRATSWTNGATTWRVIFDPKLQLHLQRSVKGVVCPPLEKAGNPLFLTGSGLRHRHPDTEEVTSHHFADVFVAVAAL